ncbi:MAG TPA: acyl-CoA dehydrogenase family protein [Hyphomicrobiaceae bacterium]|jgi:alkylation response protein AidB-like acyl-CoA dehydrogenase|nr:acyl-CoA dehydrogenase family protein [Hyphomicrobiaceae bacterium]
MHFALTEEQAAIQETALSFAKERIAPNAAEWDETSHFPVDVIRETAGLGMATIYVPAEQGGSGLTRMDGALIMEALAYGCPAIAGYISIHNMVAWMLARYAAPEQVAAWMPKLASMQWLSSYCLTEPGAGSDAAALKTMARRAGDHYVLNGTKQFISGAGATDFYFVFARTGDEGPGGISAFAVMKGTPGFSFGANERKMGWNAQPTRQLIFEDCKVPAENRIGAEGQGFKFAMSGLDGGRINIGACSLGAAWAALEKARDYMFERKAFGRAIADFQALQFKIADMATELEAARLMVYRAADAIDRADPQASMYSAMAKRLATDLGFKVVNDALQIHGGYGYLKDYGMEKLVRDLRVHQILEGTNEVMRVVISRKLLGGNRG